MIVPQERGCLESLASVFTALALFALALSVLLLIALMFAAALAVFLALRFVTRRYVMPQFYPATAVFAEQRLFGAPPDSQLFSAFDNWLLCLERATGLTFTESPGQLLVGSILVALAPALVVGLPLALLDPAGGSGLLTGLLVFGFLLGGFTGYRLGQPTQGWFDGVGSSRGLASGESREGFTLGEEEW